MDERWRGFVESKSIEKILGTITSTKIATKRSIKNLYARKKQIETKIQECDESIETLAKNDLELC
jgi:hypothetical protein